LRFLAALGPLVSIIAQTEGIKKGFFQQKSPADVPRGTSAGGMPYRKQRGRERWRESSQAVLGGGVPDAPRGVRGRLPVNARHRANIRGGVKTPPYKWGSRVLCRERS